MSDPLTYVYAITPAPGPDLPGVSGVDGATVRLVSSGALAAVVSTVAEESFDETALRTRLEQMDTLESLARAHHTVIDAAGAREVVLPLRLATVYRGDQRVLDLLDRGHDRFRDALERLTDRREWGVKVYTDPSTALAAERPAGPSDPGPGAERSAAPSSSRPVGERPVRTSTAGAAGGSSPGKDYLRRRRQEQRSAEEVRRATAEFAGRVDAELCTLAADVRHYRAQNPQLSGAQGENVLNAAYLIPEDRTEAFTAAVRALNGSVPGTRVELTGPWAPYSFTLPDPEPA